FRSNKNAIDVVTGAGAATGGGDVNLTVLGGSITGRGAQGTNGQNGILLWERAGGTVNAVIDGVTIADIEYTGADSSAGILQYGSSNGRLTVRNSTFDNVERYIVLTAGSANGVDATQGNIFDTVSIEDATLEQLFAIEDRIDHGLDAAGNGLVRVRDGQVYVTQDSGSVQRGVSVAASGDTVHIGNGTYADDFTVDRGLTFEGSTDAILTGQMIVRTGEDVTVNGLHFRLTGDQAINLEPYNATVGAMMDGMTLTLHCTEFDGNGRGVWGLLMGNYATINLNLNNTHFWGMDYAAYLGGDHVITATDSNFDVRRAFVAPTNGAVFNLTDNFFGGVAINVGTSARIGGLTMSGTTYTGAQGDSAAIRVSAGEFSYLLEGDRTLDHGIVFAAANSSINSAIAAAETDDTVYVGAGTYAETVNIDRSISLTGDSQAGTIIAGGVRINSHTAPGLLIDGVDISNLTINAGNGQVGLIALSNSADNQFNTTNLTVTNVT